MVSTSPMLQQLQRYRSARPITLPSLHKALPGTRYTTPPTIAVLSTFFWLQLPSTPPPRSLWHAPDRDGMMEVQLLPGQLPPGHNMKNTS
jgi:hypothetical protein